MSQAHCEPQPLSKRFIVVGTAFVMLIIACAGFAFYNVATQVQTK